MEHGAFCGVFDGHGKNGHIVSRTVRNRLPSLLLNQKNALEKIKTVGDHNNEKADGGLAPLPSESFHKWKEACICAFKVMDKEIKLQEGLDCSCSGTTAVVVVRQVRKQAILSIQIILNQSFPFHLQRKGCLFICFLIVLLVIWKMKTG
jgi:serine/threonine protein phosphatase PrpC